jgi:hypothetical protein
MQWTVEQIALIDKLRAQGVSNAALAERFGHRDGITFKASYTAALRRLERHAAARPAPCERVAVRA